MSIWSFVVKARHSSGNEFRNIHYYNYAGGKPTVAELQETVDGIDSAYKTNLQSRISTSVETYAYDVREVDVADQPTVEYIATAGAWSGSEASEILPFQLAGLVSFKSLTAFPRNARTYLYGFVENVNVSGGLVGSGAMTAFTAWGNDMLSIPVTGILDPDKQAVRFGGTPRVVTDNNRLDIVIVNDVWATQRRRRKGVGI